MVLLQLLVNGIQTGTIYALTAIGFALIFGSTRIFHFAHGAIFVIAAYVFKFAIDDLSLHWGIASIAAVSAAVVAGLLVNFLIYVPIQRHEGSYFTVFVASFGVVIVVQNAIAMIFGRGFVAIETSLSNAVEVLSGLFMAPLFGIVVACSAIVLTGLHLILTRTHFGIALRALSQNPELVRTFGLSPRRLSAYAFVLGSALVVPAAIFTGATSGLNPSIGLHIMLISLVATIAGGIGSIWGAACIALAIGVAENLVLWQLDTQWSEAVAFAFLLVFLIFRPAGLFRLASTH